jgi:hypothetical protein
LLVGPLILALCRESSLGDSSEIRAYLRQHIRITDWKSSISLARGAIP